MQGNTGKIQYVLQFSAFLALIWTATSHALTQPTTRHALTVPTCNTPTTPFCNAVMTPPSNWQGVVFQLSQDYPKKLTPDSQPWRTYDPRVKPFEYLAAVLKYFYEGNINEDPELSFDVSKNRSRVWYHAPWQDFGVNGREFVHGLTRERNSEPGELHPLQKHYWHNYAVGFYNPPGGYTIGKVWNNKGRPDASLANFPEGTVATKLLFTTASVAEVPYLKGAPEWTAYVYTTFNSSLRPKAGDPRVLKKVRLLQIDVAVKDSRVASTTGWVFGTFVYGGGLIPHAGSGWTNVHPVGLMWGNDPNYSGEGKVQETILNPDVSMLHYGWQGRLNGPVDNKISSCLSCHSTGQDPFTAMVPPAVGDVSRWFRNIKSGQPFDEGGLSTDYSLQLSTGIANFRAAQSLGTNPSKVMKIKLFNLLDEIDPRTPREGGMTH